MSKIPIIVRREVLSRVGKKSFVVMTVLTPFVLAALIFVPLWLASIKDSEPMPVVIADSTGCYAPLFRSDAAFSFRVAPADEGKRLVGAGEADAVVVITDNLLRHPQAAAIYAPREVPPGLTRQVNDVLSRHLRQERLAAYRLPHMERIVRDAEAEFSIRTVKWDAHGGERQSDATLAALVGMGFTFLIYLFVLTYGGQVMQGVTEEKTNRIVELMVSSVRPFELMIGKIIGVGLVGLLQLAIWGVLLATLLLAAGAALGLTGATMSELVAPSSEMVGSSSDMLLPAAAAAGATGPGGELLSALGGLPWAELVALFVLYFVGGYVLYASFFAAVGASVSAQEDSSQFMTPVVLLMIFGLYAAIYSLENPDGPLALWGSLVPLTAPIVMMVRVPFGVPLWQEVLSLVLLYATAFLMVWLAGRIYRVGILMYGKKPSLKEMMRWVGYR